MTTAAAKLHPPTVVGKVSAKEAHAQIRKLTEAVSRRERVPPAGPARELEQEAFGKGGGGSSNREPR